MKSIEVFISYHQKDEELHEELEKHLAILLREQGTFIWWVKYSQSDSYQRCAITCCLRCDRST